MARKPKMKEMLKWIASLAGIASFVIFILLNWDKIKAKLGYQKVSEEPTPGAGSNPGTDSGGSEGQVPDGRGTEPIEGDIRLPVEPDEPGDGSDQTPPSGGGANGPSIQAQRPTEPMDPFAPYIP